MFKRTLKKSLTLIAVLSLLTIVFGELPAYALVDISAVTEGPMLENPNRNTLVRDGGQSAKVGNKILWTFGDTLFNPPSVGGKSGWSNTAGLADPTNPLSVSEPLDANNAPYQSIPFSANDQAYNDTANSGSDRYAIWVQGIVPRPQQNDALVYYLRLKVGAGYLNYDSLNTGIAIIPNNSTTATIANSALYTEPGPLFNGGVFGHEGYIYLYDCGQTTDACSIARVTVSGALNIANYKYWNGTEWDTNINNRVQNMPGQSAGWSEALSKYVMFSGQFLTGKVFMRTSDQPQGPWSEPQLIYTAPAYIYAVEYHPELSTRNGKTLLLTYYQPNTSANRGLHSLTVDLNLPNRPDVPPSVDPPNSNPPNSNLPAPTAPKTGFLYPLLYILSAAGVTGVALVTHKASQRRKQKPSEK